MGLSAGHVQPAYNKEQLLLKFAGNTITLSPKKSHRGNSSLRKISSCGCEPVPREDDVNLKSSLALRRQGRQLQNLIKLVSKFHSWSPEASPSYHSEETPKGVLSMPASRSSPALKKLTSPLFLPFDLNLRPAFLDTSNLKGAFLLSEDEEGRLRVVHLFLWQPRQSWKSLSPDRVRSQWEYAGHPES